MCHDDDEVDQTTQADPDLVEEEDEDEYETDTTWWSDGLLYDENGIVFPGCLRHLVSIESATLTINSGGSHEIYGKIMVSGWVLRVYAVYDRKEDEAETVAEGEPYDLTLCGPKHEVEVKLDGCIYVRLYEKGSDVPFLKDTLRFYGEEEMSSTWDRNHQPLQIVSKGDRATLSVTFTRFTRAMPALVHIYPVKEIDEAESQWTVSGTVKAIQMSTPKLILRPLILQTRPVGKPLFRTSCKRTVTLLRSSGGVKVSSGGQIPLHRNVVVAPIQFDDIGPSLAIEVDLCFVQHGNEIVHRFNGRTKTMVFDAYHCTKNPTRDTIDPIHKIDSYNGGGPDRLHIVVAPFDGLSGRISDEEDEYDYEANSE